MPLRTQNTFPRYFRGWITGTWACPPPPPPRGGWLVLARLWAAYRLVLLGLPNSPNKPMPLAGLIGAYTQLALPRVNRWTPSK
jgi:hypothetical protein